MSVMLVNCLWMLLSKPIFVTKPFILSVCHKIPLRVYNIQGQIQDFQKDGVCGELLITKTHTICFFPPNEVWGSPQDPPVSAPDPLSYNII